LLIGAPFQMYSSSIVSLIGAVYISEYSNGQWTTPTLLSTGELTSGFDASVAIDGDTLVIGAPYPSIPYQVPDILAAFLPAERIGKVYVAERVGGSWSLSATFSEGVEGGSFGTSVAINGNTLAVWAPNTPNSATVYLYERPDGDSPWSLINKFKAGETVPTSSNLREILKGVTLSLDKDTLVVGAPHNNQKGIKSGAVYLFKRRKNGWVQEQVWQQTTTNTTITSQEMISENTHAGDQFGFATTLYENNLLVGAPKHNPNGIQDSGAVHVFELTDINSAPKLDNNGKMHLTAI
jgi:hypothetical protein